MDGLKKHNFHHLRWGLVGSLIQSSFLEQLAKGAIGIKPEAHAVIAECTRPGFEVVAVDLEMHACRFVL